MVAFDALALELSAHGFFPVLVIELICPTDGEMRLALPPSTELGEQHPCPVCGEQAQVGNLQSRGFSRRQPPFTEQIVFRPKEARKLKAIAKDEEKPVASAAPVERVTFVRGRARQVSRKGERSGARNSVALVASL